MHVCILKKEGEGEGEKNNKKHHQAAGLFNVKPERYRYTNANNVVGLEY